MIAKYKWHIPVSNNNQFSEISYFFISAEDKKKAV